MSDTQGWNNAQKFYSGMCDQAQNLASYSSGLMMIRKFYSCKGSTFNLQYCMTIGLFISSGTIVLISQTIEMLQLWINSSGQNVAYTSSNLSCIHIAMKFAVVAHTRVSTLKSAHRFSSSLFCVARRV